MKERQINGDIPNPWIGRTDIVKMSIAPQIIYRFDATSIKISMTFFTEIFLTILKILNNQSNLEKKEQSLRHHTSLSKTIYQAVVIKTDN